MDNFLEFFQTYQNAYRMLPMHRDQSSCERMHEPHPFMKSLSPYYVFWN